MLKSQKNTLGVAKVLHHKDELLVLQTMTCDTSVKDTLNELDGALLTKHKNSYGMFNLGLHVNAEPIQVFKNRCLLIDDINHYLLSATFKDRQDAPKITNIHWLTQVHGKQVIEVSDANLNKNNHMLSMQPEQADAMITSHIGYGLAIMTADCVPIVLFNKFTGQIAAIHAGWQGLANGVIAKTIQAFKTKIINTETKAQPEIAIEAWIGACISVENYEVSLEVCDKLVAGSIKNVFSNSKVSFTQEELTQTISKPHKDKNKVWLDIQTLAVMQLKALGCSVSSSSIPCSYGDTRYYSYRRKTHLNQPNTGRMAMVVVKL